MRDEKKGGSYEIRVLVMSNSSSTPPTISLPIVIIGRRPFHKIWATKVPEASQIHAFRLMIGGEGWSSGFVDMRGTGMDEGDEDLVEGERHHVAIVQKLAPVCASSRLLLSISGEENLRSILEDIARGEIRLRIYKCQNFLIR